MHANRAGAAVGDVDHEGTIELAAPLVRNWFDEIGSAVARAGQFH